MDDQETSIVFGPVPSRRLGQSLGINNIPPKICSYSCVYCQIGRTRNMSDIRMQYYTKEYIFGEVQKKIRKAEERGEKIDYLTFVPDGEPTLDINLGKEIELLRKTEKKIAVITNSSLLGRDDVRKDLYGAHLVSLKVDAVSELVWRKINRPKRSLNIETIFKGIMSFSEYFKGELITETMLIKGVNDGTRELSKISEYLARVNPKKSYLSIPIRPPAESWVEPADEHTLSVAYALFSQRAIKTEYLIGYEGNTFAFTGNIERDLLSITSVHPMRKDAVEKYLEKAHANWHEVETLIKSEKLLEVAYKQDTFYVRKLR